MATGWSGVDPAAWSGQKDRLLTALLRNSVQALANEAGKTIPNGGRVPVKTGNLARSVVVENKPPQQGAADTRYSGGDVTLGVSKVVPGEPVWIGWQAAYSRRLNYGFVGADSLGRVYNQSGHGFAEATAAKWGAIVAEQAAKLGGR